MHVDRTRTGLLWISPWLIGVACFLVLPLCMSFVTSFTDDSILEPRAFVGLANYKQALASSLFYRVLFNTLAFAIVSVSVATVLGLALAVLLERARVGSVAARAIIFLPSVVPMAAAGVVWMWLLSAEQGLVNRALAPVLAVFSVSPPAWLSSQVGAFISVIIVSSWQIGQSVVIYQAALRQVPASLLEAASLDGAMGFQRFWFVTLPAMRHVVFFSIITGIFAALQSFVVPYVMTGGGPGVATRMYAMEIYDRAFLLGPQLGYACALAWLQMLLVVALSVVLFRTPKSSRSRASREGALA